MRKDIFHASRDGQRYTQEEVQILRDVHISDNLKKIDLDNLPEQVRLQIASSKLQGIRVVLVFWETGQYGILPCPPGSNMPAPDQVVAAYRGSRALRTPDHKEGA